MPPAGGQRACQEAASVAIVIALPTLVIAAKAGTQYTSHRGCAPGTALRGERAAPAASRPSLRSDLGARLRGHDAAVRDARDYAGYRFVTFGWASAGSQSRESA